MMQLSLCPQALYRRSLDDALARVRDLGVHAIELPLDSSNPWIRAEDLAEGDADVLRGALDKHGIALSAVSVHQEGQLLLGPHHKDTDRIHPGNAAEKSAFAAERIRRAGRIAKVLGVDTVVGFVGCEDYSRFFPWPDPDGWEAMLPSFRDAALPVLDDLADAGVRFAQEPHPKQIVYNTETAVESVAVLDEHPAWGFNVDAANLLLAGVDPVVFVAELGPRVLHVHAKDGELVAHHARRSGLLAHGSWARKDRGFRFRVAGWGDVDWKRFVSELIVQDFGGHLAIEHEDPLFGAEDGLRKAADYLKALLPDGDREDVWW